MGNDCSGHARRDDGFHDACLSGHNDDANGDARSNHGRERRPYGHLSRRGELLAVTRSDRQDLCTVLGRSLSRVLGRSVRLGREDPGNDHVRVLFRLHHHAHTRRLVGAKVWWQIHRGLRDILHVRADAAYARRGAYGIHAPDDFAFRRRTRRSMNELVRTVASLYFTAKVVFSVCRQVCFRTK